MKMEILVVALAENMSKWINSRMSVLTDNQRAAVLRTEYGGMNEVLYNLYAITKNPRDKQNAEYFNEAKYLNAWANGTDNLNITHANTTVPKAVGFIRGYQVTGDRKLLNAAVNFWEMTAGSGNRRELSRCLYGSGMYLCRSECTKCRICEAGIYRQQQRR